LVASTLLTLFSEMLEFSQKILLKEKIICVYTNDTSFLSIRRKGKAKMQNYLRFEIMNI
jgi:hypothetical protein